MRTALSTQLIILFSLFIGSHTFAQEQTHPGQAVYQQYCAACHDNAQATRAVSVDSLRSMRRSAIEYALTLGYMRIQAKDLSQEQMNQVMDWLVLDQPDYTAWLEDAMCTGDKAKVDPNATPIIPTWGLGNKNLRHISATDAGIQRGDFSNLALAWAFALPQTSSMRSQPVVAGDTIFVSSADAGRIYALDSETACVKWQYEGPTLLRSSLSYGELEPGQPIIVVGDPTGAVTSIDALTGKQLWRTDIRMHEANRITGTPVIYRDKVFGVLSGSEINYARDDAYECCTAQGAVIALDIKSGAKLWAGRTMDPPQKTDISRAGTQLWGPSGAPIWSTPAIDEKRNRLYVGTGENNSLPVTGTSDAILAFDIDTGKRIWSFQATRKDAWNYACRSGANCDWKGEAIIVDHDFGGSVMITQREDGRDLLVVGQKSGTTWALDPDRNGELVWSTTIGSGGFNGGIHWGTATDGKRVFVPLNDRYSTNPDAKGKPGLYALDLETGKMLWEQPAQPDCSGERKDRFPGCETRIGYSPAPLVVDGAVIQGSIDGMLHVFDTTTGKQIWKYNTLRDFETVNGIPGNGGSIDSSPYVAANGTLFVVSGYARFGETPGNVLLAFRPR